MQGIPPELRNQIYGLVVAIPTDNRIILGRKLAQAAKKLEYDGDVREQALSTVVQHPLSMTCRQIRAEFQSGFQDAYTRSQSQSYEFVVNNFDIEQLKLFEELEHARHVKRLILVKSPTQLSRDLELAWLSKVPFKLRFQMDCNVVASAAALQNFEELCRRGERCYSIVNEENNLVLVEEFTMTFEYCDQLTGVVVESRSMTVSQAEEAFNFLARSTKGTFQWMLYKLYHRFTELLGAYKYRESQRKSRLGSIAAEPTSQLGT